MVSALVSRASGPVSSPGRGHYMYIVFLDKTLNSYGALLHQVYKWVSANLMLGGNPGDGLASHPGGSRNTPSHFMPQKPG